MKVSKCPFDKRKADLVLQHSTEPTHLEWWMLYVVEETGEKGTELKLRLKIYSECPNNYPPGDYSEGHSIDLGIEQLKLLVGKEGWRIQRARWEAREAFRPAARDGGIHLMPLLRTE